MQQAFGSNLAAELIKSYDGSNLVADSQQDLVGERYLAEQIRLIQEQQKTTSVLDKWSHLLYEGESDYQRSPSKASKAMTLQSNFNENSNEYTSQHQSLQKQQQQQIQQQQLQQQLRLSQSGNLPQSGSFQRLVNVPSQNSLGTYVHSQSGLNARTQSDIRLAQSQAQAQANFRAQVEAQSREDAIAQAQAHAHAQLAQAQAQANAHARALEQAKLNSQTQSQLKKSSSHVQQPQSYLPQLSNSNLNSVTLEAYNSPQFKAMLEELSRPMNVPPEQINYPPEWPSQDRIGNEKKNV